MRAALPALIACFLGLATLVQAFGADATDPRVDSEVQALSQVLAGFHFVSSGSPLFSTEPDPLRFGVYRGAVPIAGLRRAPEEWTPELQKKLDLGVKLLATRLGVRTILDLEASHWLRRAEAVAAARAGVRFISKPLVGIVAKPTQAKLYEIIQLLNDPTLYPIYVHCRYGQDRTGAVIGLYRVLLEGMPPEEAFHEMKELGFRSMDRSPWVAGLECAYRRLTGMPEPRVCRLIPTADWPLQN